MKNVAPKENSFNYYLLTYYVTGSLGMKKNKTKPLPSKSSIVTCEQLNRIQYEAINAMGAPKKEGLILPNTGDRGHGMENYRLPRQGSGLTFFQLY